MILGGGGTWAECSPADECCDDDAPRCAAAVGVGPILAFAPPAAKTNGVEEQEHEVQGQADQRQSSQQKDGLVDRGTGLWTLHSWDVSHINNRRDNGLLEQLMHGPPREGTYYTFSFN